MSKLIQMQSVIVILGSCFISCILCFSPHVKLASIGQNHGRNKLTANLFSGISWRPVGILSNKSEKIKRAEDIKGLIKSYSRGTSNGVASTPDIKSKISELVKELEKLNFESNLSSNSKLEGTWRLLYTTNDGSSAGKIGPFVGQVDQSIFVNRSLYYNYVKLGPNIFEGALSATWDVIDRKNWRVKFQDIVFKVFGVVVLQKSLEGSVGIWRMSYLDDTFRILYAQGGKNTVIENIYILSKD